MNEKNTKSNENIVKKQKKAIIITFICLIGFVVIYGILSMIDWSSIFPKDNESHDEYIYFYSEDLSKDLDSDEHYILVVGGGTGKQAATMKDIKNILDTYIK